MVFSDCSAMICPSENAMKLSLELLVNLICSGLYRIFSCLL